MRALILIAGAALALAGCGKTDQAANSANVDESLSSQQVLTNDVTAIDAVTAEDSNMAADVPLDNSLDNLLASSNSATGSKSRPPSTKPATGRAATTTTAAASNSSAAATANNSL